MKTIYYYNSPIGILKLECNDNYLEEILFVEEEGENSNFNLDIAFTCKDQLDRYFDGTLKQFTIPIRFKVGTEFQKKVWNALSQIEYGTTSSYKDIAIKIGNAKAVRAVGGANNKNPLPIVVPCHRVVGSEGELVGYAGGLDKKTFLIELEKK